MSVRETTAIAIRDSLIESEFYVSALLAELKWLDPENPTLAVVRAARHGEDVRWLSLKRRYQIAKERDVGGLISARLSGADTSDRPAQNMSSEGLAASVQGSCRSSRALHPMSAETCLHSRSCCRESDRSGWTVPARLRAILRFPSWIFTAFRGRFATTTIAEGAAIPNKSRGHEAGSPGGAA